MEPWREFVAKVGRAGGTMRQSRDEQLQESAALTCRVEDQKEEVVGVGGATQKELGLWWGLPHRSCGHRGTCFPKGGRTPGEFPQRLLSVPRAGRRRSARALSAS